MNSLAFTTPCTAIISGPTASGKSTFRFRTLCNLKHMFQTPVKKIYYFYGVWQKLFEVNSDLNVEYIKDIPNEHFLQELESDYHNLVIIDDLQSSALNNGFIANLFSREAHHRNLCLFNITKFVSPGEVFQRHIFKHSLLHFVQKSKRLNKNQIKILRNQLGIGKKIRLIRMQLVNRSLIF